MSDKLSIHSVVTAVKKVSRSRASDLSDDDRDVLVLAAEYLEMFGRYIVNVQATEAALAELRASLPDTMTADELQEKRRRANETFQASEKRRRGE